MLCASGQAFALPRRPSPLDRRLSMRFLGVFTPFHASVSGRGSAKGFSRRPSCRGKHCLAFPLPLSLPSSMGPPPKGRPSCLQGLRAVVRPYSLFAFCGFMISLFSPGVKCFLCFFRFFSAVSCFLLKRTITCVFYGCYFASYLTTAYSRGRGRRLHPIYGLAVASAVCWGLLLSAGGFCLPWGFCCLPWLLLSAGGLAPVRWGLRLPAQEGASGG